MPEMGEVAPDAGERKAAVGDDQMTVVIEKQLVGIDAMRLPFRYLAQLPDPARIGRDGANQNL